MSMKRDRFLLDSDQLELLMAFEESEGLTHLAEKMAKDPSVISRGLQKIAETYPVLTKVQRRWEMTPLGRELNLVTKDLIKKQLQILGSQNLKQAENLILKSDAVLLVVNAQCGLLDSTQLGRNNSEAETNIASLMSFWRNKKRQIIHVKHISENPSSIFYRSSKKSDFLPGLGPLGDELIIEKSHSSAFSDTTLLQNLKKTEPSQLALAGFTANECIDATARDASTLGFATYVIGDATAMFDLKTSDGKLIKADRLHRLTLANINAFYARVLQTSEVLNTSCFV